MHLQSALAPRMSWRSRPEGRVRIHDIGKIGLRLLGAVYSRRDFASIYRRMGVGEVITFRGRRGQDDKPALVDVRAADRCLRRVRDPTKASRRQAGRRLAGGHQPCAVRNGPSGNRAGRPVPFVASTRFAGPAHGRGPQRAEFTIDVSERTRRNQDIVISNRREETP